MAKNPKKPNRQMGVYPNEAQRIMASGFSPASGIVGVDDDFDKAVAGVQREKIGAALKRWAGASLLALGAAAAWQLDAMKGLFA